MKIIPTEGRATMQAYRHGISLESFLDGAWLRRQQEEDRETPCVVDLAPERIRAAANWPGKSRMGRHGVAIDAADAAANKPADLDKVRAQRAGGK